MTLVIRSVICEVCKLPRRTPYVFDVCMNCARRLKKVRCGACNRLFHQVTPQRLLCCRCTNLVVNEKIVCEYCGASDFALKIDPTQCRRCHKNSVVRKWESALPDNVICVGCGLAKKTCRKNEMICRTCDIKRRSAGHKCSIDGCTKPVHYKKLLLCEWHNRLRLRTNRGIMCIVEHCKKLAHKKSLCSHHYLDQLAKGTLRKYVQEYTAPFSQNAIYFADLASTINWSAPLTAHDLRRFRAIGEFLKVNQLPEVLTWKVSDDARPAYGKADRIKMLIRSCLVDLGNLYAERGVLQDRNSYLLERRLHSLKSTPVVFRENVFRFQEWVLRGMLNPKSEPMTECVDVLANTHEQLISAVASVNAFLNWCERNQVNALSAVDAAVVDAYQKTLLWKFRCRKCGKCIPFDSRGAGEKCINEQCEATDSYVRVNHLARNSRTVIVSRLRVFFDWAVLHGVVSHNPILNSGMRSGPSAFTVVDERGRRAEVSGAIRRYDDRVIQQLCTYIVSPEADPMEALVYYLTIFHLLTPTEIRYLRIPSLVNGKSTMSDAERNSDYKYLILPAKKPSRGRNSVRRTEQKIEFPPKALPWLVPLLERFYEGRRTHRAYHNEYFVITGNRARGNKPVSHTYLFKLVQEGSQRLLGGTINLSNLQRTAAAIISQRSKRRSAVLTMMGYGRKSSTRFNYLDSFPLSPIQTKRIALIPNKKNAPAPSGGVA
jgi:hypothetical protein